MKKYITRERIFEVMSRLDKTFKPKLNEGVGNDEYLPITTPLGSQDDKLFTSVVNQGIDSHLEGFTQSKFDVQGNRRVFNFHKSEIPILLRRLEEVGTEEALMWKDDIENYKEEPLDEIASGSTENEFDPPGDEFFTLRSTSNEPVKFELHNYTNNNALAVELVGADGEPWVMLSVNLPESDALPKDEFFLKNWTENEDIARELVVKKYLIHTGKQASMGAYSFKINPQRPVQAEAVNLNEGSGLGTPVNKWVYFSFNFPYNFIGMVWEGEAMLVNHLNEKFLSLYDKYGAAGVMNKFYTELDSGNQKKLEDWVLANYKG
jgi:hypothetical protein